MTIDQTQNFVKVDVSGTHTDTDTTIQLASGEASTLPDPANGEYNLVWWDAGAYQPDTDPDVEIVRVTSVDTANDTVTVSRGQENTSAVAHDSDTSYSMILAATSKTFEDIEAALSSTYSEETVSVSESYTTAGETTVFVEETSYSYDITSASYTGNSLATQDTYTAGIRFNDDGTKMYEVEMNTPSVRESTLSTAYDITTASYTGNSVTCQDSSPSDIAFNSDGTIMIELGSWDGQMHEYSLSTAYDISTASYTGNTVSTQDGNPEGFTFSSDGKTMLEIGDSSGTIYEYTLSTAYDITTASYTGNSISVQNSYPTDIIFNDDGTQMFELDSGGDFSGSTVYEYELSTAYDLTTASHTGNTMSPESSTSGGIVFDSEGTKMFDVDYDNDTIYSYTGLGNTIGVTLGSSDVSDGKVVRVMDKNGNAGKNSLTISTESSETINGESDAVINSSYETLTFQSDGSDWYIIGRTPGGGIQ